MASSSVSAAEAAGPGWQRLGEFGVRDRTMYLLHHPHLELREGDTLVFIDMPPTADQDPTDCFGVPWVSTTFRVSSQKLRATGSSRFERMLKEFGLRASKKAQARGLKTEDIQGVKWCIDLTPDHEGEDMVFQMAAMSLTPGITHWWTAVAKYGVSRRPVSSHDDVCNCRLSENPPPNPVAAPARGRESTPVAQPGGRDGPLGDGPEPEQHPPYRMIPDYCPIRHRVTILRLLYLIHGIHMPIFSAPQMWTLAAIAEIFECLDVVRELVVQWHLFGGNAVFMEVLPEETLRVGATFQIIPMVRTAFRVLVNELALEEAGTKKKKGDPTSPKVTLFGRRRQSLEDDWSNAIQHAARAMVDRISSLVRFLQSDNLFDQLDLGQWQRLKTLERLLETRLEDGLCFEAFSSARTLSRALEDYFRREILGQCLVGNVPENGTLLPIYDADRKLHVDRQDYKSTAAIYHSFNPVQRALCSIFYGQVAMKWRRHRYQLASFDARSIHTPFATQAAWLLEALEKLAAARPGLVHGAEWRGLFVSEHGMMNNWWFRLDEFEAEITDALDSRLFAVAALTNVPVPHRLTRHLLLILTDNEYRYLPLWAGGDDDGTGGVFEAELPPAELGPVGPGPSYRTGLTFPSHATDGASSLGDELRSLALDEWSMVSPDSLKPQVDGASTIYDGDECDDRRQEWTVV